MAIHTNPLSWLRNGAEGIVVLEREPIARASIVRDLVLTAMLSDSSTPREEMQHLIKKLEANTEAPRERTGLTDKPVEREVLKQAATIALKAAL